MEAKCSKCKKRIEAGTGCYDFPSGILCVECYDEDVGESAAMAQKELFVELNKILYETERI